MPSKPREQVVSIKPIPVPTSEREYELQVKVSAPTSGNELPVIVFSHGNGWSMDAYEPLVDEWARAGFVVVQGTHLDSRRNNISVGDPRYKDIWRVRIEDLHAIIDNLEAILFQAVRLDLRSDHERVAAIGHSWGAQSVSTLLGARVLDEDGNLGQDFSHPAIKAGVLIGVPGTGESLTPYARQHLAFMRPEFSAMIRPALIVAGGKDQSRLSARGPEWYTDAFHLSPSPKHLLEIAGAEHTFGGVAGEAVAETTDADPARVALVATAASAYLRAFFGVGEAHWLTLKAQASENRGIWTLSEK